MSDLFPEMHTESNLSLLDFYARQGLVFLTTKQVMTVMSKSYGQIRYAIMNYELDAFYIEGDYRITIQACKDYCNKLQEQYESIYHAVMGKLELDGVYELANGSNISRLVESVHQHGYPITAIDDLLKKTGKFDYDRMDQGETAKKDFYNIKSLAIPDCILLCDFANMLSVNVAKLFQFFETQDPYVELTYPEVFDFLVEHEVVNASVPFTTGCSQLIVSPARQLELF